jgi:hypothetical protein
MTHGFAHAFHGGLAQFRRVLRTDKTGDAAHVRNALPRHFD